MIDKDDWDELIANVLTIGAILAALIPWLIGVYIIIRWFFGAGGVE